MGSGQTTNCKFGTRKVIICQGLPASGKSTWSKKFCEENPQFIRVCRDDLRNMRGRYMIPKQEKLITDMELSCIHNALVSGYNVVIDATNLKTEYVEKIKLIAMGSTADGVQFEIQDFTHVTPEECIERDLKRPNSVGAKVIWHFYDKYLRPKYEVIRDTNLPHAIICDLDGTLCLHNGRSPYDIENCDKDLPNQPIIDIAWGALHNAKKNGKNLTILFVSGRYDTVREKTLQWLEEKCNFFEPTLLMRKADDNRNDSIVKREIFMEHINGKYYIDFVLDDRNRVVDMWRKDLGLTCLQVNYGDF